MGLISFIKEAGEKLFGKAHASTGSGGDAEAKAKAASENAGQAIIDYIRTMNLDATGLRVTFDGNTGVATVYGVAKDQETKEKIILCCGNVSGVSAVDDRMTVDKSSPEGKYYTVVSGDTLSKIAKQHYGNANDYMKIFEANKPMLKDPDKIYPGQKLRIPA